MIGLQRCGLLRRPGWFSCSLLFGVALIGLTTGDVAGADKPGAATAGASDAKSREPATADEAAKVLDLQNFPLMEGGKVQGGRRLARLHYEVEAEVKTAFEFSRQQLLKQGWTEQAGSQVQPTYAGGNFTKDGFTAYVSVLQFGPDTPKKGVSQVMIGNYGNVDLAKLPVPPGAKPFYALGGETSYLTEAKVPETTEVCRKLLVASGWAPYGTASDDPASPMLYFKRNAVRLMAWVSSAPAQGGKTVIKYSTEQLSADLPMPSTAPDPRYSDEDKTVRFDWPNEDGSEVIAFYQTELTKKGWKATTEQPIVDESKGQQFLVFRNPQKEMISLDLARYTKSVQVLVQHRSAAEVAEQDRLAKEQAERAREEQARRNAKVKVALPLPDQVRKLEQSGESGLEFTLKSGRGAEAFKQLREHFRSDGWAEGDEPKADPTIGHTRLKKEYAELSISFFDTPVSGAEVTISGTGVILEPQTGKGGKSAGDNAPKAADRGTKKGAPGEIPGLSNLPEGIELPDLGDAPGEVQDLVKKALEDAGVAGGKKKGSKTKKGTVAAGAVKVADIPVPEDVTELEYNKTAKMISLKSPTDVKPLAEFFEERLTDKGWTKGKSSLVSENSAILKMSQGEAELTIFLSKRDEGSEATVTTRGLAWDSVPPSKKAPKKAVAGADKKSAEKKAAEKKRAEKKRAEKKKPVDPDDDDDDDDEKEEREPQKKSAPVRKTFTARPVTPAEQKQTGVKVTIDQTVHRFEYGVAFESPENDKPTTVVLLAEKPIPVERIVAGLNQGKDPDLAGIQRHLKFRFDEQGKMTYLFMYADGLSINRGGTIGPDYMDTEITIAEGRARGKGIMKAPEKFFDQQYRIEAPFDVKLGTAPADPSAAPAAGDSSDDALVAEEEEGLPVPDSKSSRFSSKSPFRETLTVVVPATIEALSRFYKRELAKRGWKENAAATKIGADEGSMSFSGPQGSLTLRMTRKEGEATVILATRNAEKAKSDGILPQPGKGRLILGNASNQNAVLTINGQKYNLAAMRGAKSPKEGLSLHVLPGKYTVSIQPAGADEQKEDLNVSVDEAWGVIVTPVGSLFADQLY